MLLFLLLVAFLLLVGCVLYHLIRSRMTAHAAKVASVAQSLALEQDALDGDPVRASFMNSEPHRSIHYLLSSVHVQYSNTDIYW